MPNFYDQTDTTLSLITRDEHISFGWKLRLYLGSVPRPLLDVKALSVLRLSFADVKIVQLMKISS